MQKIGQILSLSISKYHGIPKFPISSVVVGNRGFVNDVHSSEPGRSISIVAKEVLDLMNLKLGINLKAGFLAENITTIGLGDLSDLEPGCMIKIGDRVILQVSEQNKPCSKINIYHKLLVKSIHGKRGVLCEVNAGVGETLKPGDKIEIIGGSVAL